MEKHSLKWFMERIGKSIFKNLKLVHEKKSITIIDVEHAKYLFYTQEKIGSEYYDKV